MAFEGPLTRDGKTLGEAVKMLENAGADIVGTNCWQDSQRMLPVVREIRKAVSCYVAAQPVAYRCTDEIPYFTGQPGFPNKLDPYQLTRFQLTRFQMGDFASSAKDLGGNYIGTAVVVRRSTCERWPGRWARSPRRSACVGRQLRRPAVGHRGLQVRVGSRGRLTPSVRSRTLTPTHHVSPGGEPGHE